MVVQPWPVFARPRADVENGSRHLATVSTVQLAEYGTRGFLRHYRLALSCLGFFSSPRLTSWLSFGPGRLLA